MTSEPQWVKLDTFNASLEAEMMVEILNQADIPTLVQGPEAGIYGFGFGGVTAKGVTIKVPSDRLEEAKQILESPPSLPAEDLGNKS